jgi:DNA-binding Lrp family transcriptional regulator
MHRGGLKPICHGIAAHELATCSGLSGERNYMAGMKGRRVEQAADFLIKKAEALATNGSW